MMKKIEGPRKAFFRHGGIYRSDVSLPLVNLGRSPAFRSGPGQAIGRAGCHTPCPSFAMSSGRLFLDGSVATVARLRFADQSTIKSGRNHNKHFSSNGNQCLNWLSQPRGPLQTADEVLTALRAVPLVLASGAAEAATEHVSFLLPQLRLLDQQLRDVSCRIREILTMLAGSATAEEEAPSDAALMLSIPGIGPAVAATLLTEAARPIRDRDYRALRCYSGTAPITKQSGKRKSTQMRYACNPRLRKALYYWASTSINCDSRSREQYDSLRTAGHHHARALRGLADRLLQILMAMLKHQAAYNPVRRQMTPAA